MRDLIKWHFGGGKRQFKAKQNELNYLLHHTDHDIGILPGGYLLHYSICWCHAPKESEISDDTK